MRRAELPLPEILVLLEQTPVRVAQVTSGLRVAELQAALQPDDWSVREVLAHLRGCADMWGGAIIAITEGVETLRAVDPRTRARQMCYAEQRFRASFEAYSVQRAELLALVSTFSERDWSRTITVTGGGAPRERSARTFAQSIAVHERAHLKQIERVVRAVRALRADAARR